MLPEYKKKKKNTNKQINKASLTPAASFLSSSFKTLSNAHSALATLASSPLLKRISNEPMIQVFMDAFPYAWSVLPINIYMTSSLTSFKCHIEEPLF